MHEIEKDLRAGMTARGISHAAQEEIVEGIKSFALYGFPESHAASFALIAYASAYLKAHHGAAFLCALLNNYPMGFYHPATLITDAAHHGVRTLPIDVTRSDWTCTLERGADGALAVRLGLKYVTGLREAVGRRLVDERRARPFTSLADLHLRARPHQTELTRLAEIGACEALGGRRRETLWQAEALGRSGALFAARPAPDGPSPLAEMSPEERTIADFRGTGVTVGPHPVTFLRTALDARGVTRSGDIGLLADGTRARIAGLVIVRQRPGTAKGIVFITLEDETGFANAVVYPDRFQAWRAQILGHPLLLIEGVVQNRDGVTTLLAERFEPLRTPTSALDVSHDFR
jgi:error-prone DNA polymerase